ncbi:hypothetical protein OMCYN_00545 [cyanobiont of Ornithocercus magnificus]|nr:hypothetical protein OMCYN_00545 [cyanobiont of Ornithocercus magnificus]
MAVGIQLPPHLPLALLNEFLASQEGKGILTHLELNQIDAIFLAIRQSSFRIT